MHILLIFGQPCSLLVNDYACIIFFAYLFYELLSPLISQCSDWSVIAASAHTVTLVKHDS